MSARRFLSNRNEYEKIDTVIRVTWNHGEDSGENKESPGNQRTI